MSDNRKYYYLKLKDTFFDSDAMIVLESMPDGYKYSNILLKLYLRSLRGDGKLMFNDRIPYNSTILAQVTRHSVGDVEKAIEIFKQLDLIEILDNGAIYIMDIQNFIGESSTEADRIRQYRNRIGKEKQALVTNVRTDVRQTSDKSTPEIEKEKELEIDKEKEKDNGEQSSQSSKLDNIPYAEIISYLNEKAGKDFRASGKDHQKHIRARFSEGFTIDDFKVVIDNMVSYWKGDPKMDGYLRPRTLFGTKFEDYLNKKPANNNNNRFDDFDYRKEFYGE